MRTLFWTSPLALACLAALLFMVPAPGALAQVTASPAEDQYGGDPENEDPTFGPPVDGRRVPPRVAFRASPSPAFGVRAVPLPRATRKEPLPPG